MRYTHIAEGRLRWHTAELACTNDYDAGDFGRGLVVDWAARRVLVSVGSTQNIVKTPILHS
jgi:hypothetical protein